MPDTNPLRDGLTRERAVDSCLFVVFGGTGDLAHRKLLPAVYHLHMEGLLPRGFALVSYASSAMSEDEYRDWVRQALAEASPRVPTDGPVWDSFASSLFYSQRKGSTAESLAALKGKLQQLDKSIGANGNCLFYFAIPPAAFPETARALGDVGLAHDERGHGWRRLVIEKPFGQDLESAEKLNSELLSIFSEDQIFRIDHYLGKETVQNILVFRFANRFVEPLLNSEYVDHIQITVAESIGIEKRGAFYDSTGALRDIVQNHVMQVMSLVCMEPPASLGAEDIRDEKAKVLACVRRIDPADVDRLAVRGQYCGGFLYGEEVPGYREEQDVAPDSRTETFVALKLHLDNWRWNGTPVYVRTGKRLAKRVTEVAIQLKDIPRALFGENSEGAVEPNLIAMNIQPQEGISVRFEAKVPGLTSGIQPVRMAFDYGAGFGASAPDAYERLILDAMLGDTSLFARADAVERSWEIVDPVLQAWRQSDAQPFCYYAGTWGPNESAGLMRLDGRGWRRL